MFNTTRLDDRLNTGLIAIALGTLVGLAAHTGWNELAPTSGRPTMAQATQPAAVTQVATTAVVAAATRRAG